MTTELEQAIKQLKLQHKNTTSTLAKRQITAMIKRLERQPKPRTNKF